MSTILKAQFEICENGIDDDNDGLIDLNDDECFCEIIEPISLIPNPSFEEMDCCPSNRSQLNCASNWIQASDPTTDFIHTCDWLGWPDFPPPQPFPDGEGIMGFRDGRVFNGMAEPFWKEYAGACLINPLLKDNLYRFQFDVGFVSPEKSPPIDITFFGTTNCEYLPFGVGNEAFGCPTNSPDWIKLAEVRLSGGAGNQWVNAFIDITPNEDIYAIAIGPDCNPVSSPISIYYFFDNLLLADFESFTLKITETLHPCSPDYTLSITSNPDFEYQWFKSGIALVGETSSELIKNYGEGIYQVRIDDGTSCRVSASFEYIIPTVEAPEFVSICDGESYQFGDLQLTEAGFYLDTFQNQNNCDSIVALNLSVIGAKYDTIEVSIINGDTYNIGNFSFDETGIYPVTLISSLGCDSLVLLNLELFNVYIPNTFSPRAEGPNNIFKPFSQSGMIKSVEMKIFDRWGNFIYSGEAWDGSNSKPGVFIYTMILEFAEGKPKHFIGDVTLIN